MVMTGLREGVLMKISGEGHQDKSVAGFVESCVQLAVLDWSLN